MPGADDLFSILGQLDQLRQGMGADVLGLTIPEILKEVVDEMGGVESVAGPLLQVVSGLGGLGAMDLSEVFGPEIAEAIGDFTDSAKKLWDVAGGSDIIEQVTRAIGSGGSGDETSGGSGDEA
jgi:hypothetical protein